MIFSSRLVKPSIIAFFGTFAFCALSAQESPWQPSPGCGCDRNTRSSIRLEDAQRTIGLVRSHAAEWRINPHKIGVLGFSAGGHLIAAVSTHFDRRAYKAVDAADRQSSRPDFAVALYPGHLFIDHDKFELNQDIHVTRNTLPTAANEVSDYGVASVGRSVAQDNRDDFGLGSRVRRF